MGFSTPADIHCLLGVEAVSAGVLSYDWYAANILSYSQSLIENLSKHHAINVEAKPSMRSSLPSQYHGRL